MERWRNLNFGLDRPAARAIKESSKRDMIRKGSERDAVDYELHYRPLDSPVWRIVSTLRAGEDIEQWRHSWVVKHRDTGHWRLMQINKIHCVMDEWSREPEDFKNE